MVDGYYFSQKRGQKYKQGLNEILSPFILLRDPPLPELDILELFYAFIDRFLPNMFEHEEFYPLQCCLKIFDLLLRYHLPEVCNRLDQYNVGPELYTTPWFLTCFSRQLSTDCLYILWDELLLDVGASPCSDLIFFFGITLVRLSASKIMTADQLPAIMAGLEMPNSQEQVRELVTSARQIRAATPSTLCHIIYEGVFVAMAVTVAVMRWDLQHWKASVAIPLGTLLWKCSMRWKLSTLCQSQLRRLLKGVDSSSRSGARSSDMRMFVWTLDPQKSMLRGILRYIFTSHLSCCRMQSNWKKCSTAEVNGAPVSGRGSRLSHARLDWAPLRSLFPTDTTPSCVFASKVSKRFSSACKVLLIMMWQILWWTHRLLREDLQEAKVLVQ